LTPTARLTWLGHSTVVLELDGARIVTDPLLSRRVAHLWRSLPVPELEAPDVVIVSHLHWDHLHVPSLRRLAAGAVLVVPTGSGRLVARLGFARVIQVARGDSIRIGEIRIDVTHAEHPSSRRSRARSDAVGYMLRGSRRVYFPGDTDLFDEMRELGDGLDLALVPVAGWGRKAAEGHLDPRKAVQALELLQPRNAVPIHWGTFAPFGLRVLGGSDTAAEDFREEAARRVPGVTVHVLQVGGSLVL
jgi:L-ascorbate metabolism protein UlaG (beta-lactamase superfamily)